MACNDNISMKGTVLAQLVGSDGTIKQEVYKDNLIVTVGKAYVASALITVPAAAFGYVACGTSNTAATIAQTALVGTELARVAATCSNPTSTTTLFSASFPAGVGTGTVEELGIFDAVAAGNMFSRYLSGTITKAAGDTLNISWTITVS